MARTTVNVDDIALQQARLILGTRGVSETINAAMAVVVRQAALEEFTLKDFDITDADLAESRRDRSVPM